LNNTCYHKIQTNRIMEGESLNIIQDQLEKLKQLFPETVSEGKIDWEKLQATLGKENIEFLNERYVLNWAGKSEAFKVLQQSTTATLKPVPGESINFDTTKNVFIEGENLEVLKVLQKAYYGKIKCIIIDPPYNTGSDSFIYPDSFKESKEDYQKRIGDKDEEGYLLKEGMFRRNSKDSGHYHSNWLSMMYPRLFLARNLLRDDGVIFVHIDDNEVHNLRLMMNEIFGEENFLVSLIRRTKSGGGSASHHFAIEHDYVMVFSKSINSLGELFLPHDEVYIKRYSEEDEIGKYFWDTFERSYTATKPYIIFAPDGSELRGSWFRSEARFKKDYADGEIRIFKKKNGNWSVQFKQRIAEGKKPRSILNEKEFKSGQEDLEKLEMTNHFSFPKTSYLIKYLIKGIIENEDIVLDFFAGSGTTAQAVLELNKEDGENRKFILVQLPEKCDEESEAYKAGYKTIADISKERIKRVIKKLETEAKELKKKKAGELPLTESVIANSKSETDLGFKVFKLSSSNFKIWRANEITEENLEQQLDAFTDPVKEGSEKENMLYELILKAGYLLTDKMVLRQAHEAKGYYSVNDGELIIVLEEMNQKLVEEIISAKPKKVITLDKLFTGNDQLKTNTVLQMHDAEIDFKTI
jgi:adenine-specific DNA-methyltransferase